jgi:hypothetical protein
MVLLNLLSMGEQMVKKSKLKHMAVTIGAAMGRADRTVHKVAKTGAAAKKKLVAISKQVEALKRQLLKNTEGLPVAGNASF